MKHFLKISSNAESKPVRLIAACVLAVIVMTFINGFIGSVGGIPAFVAFVTMFYLLRTVVSAGNRITHQLAMSSRREIAYLIVSYGVGYLILWAVFRLGLMYSKVTGWGNLNGASALEYVRGLLETSMLEKWAYFFAGLFMFAFVMSLFPLVVIRRKSTWLSYAIMDGAIAALLCEAIGGICRVHIGEKLFAGSICLSDYLLLCGDLKEWQKALCIVGMLFFVAGVSTFAFFFAAHCYGPKMPRMNVDTSMWQPGYAQPSMADKRLLRRNMVLTGVGVLLLGAVMTIVFFAPDDTGTQYEKAAEFLTEDSVLGPMEYGGTIYIPVDQELDLYETGTPLGYLADKGEECDSRFYELTIGNVLYQNVGEKSPFLQVYGANIGSFVPIGMVESTEEWRQDSVFLLWDEEWVSESAYSHEPTGYTTCDQAFVEKLEAQFGHVDYRVSDFTNYDAYFSLCGYTDLDAAMTEELTPGNWVGCILVKDNKFYYGNYDNLITGVCLQELLDVLGGY